MRYEIASLSAELNLPDRFFLTREKGEQAYNILAGALAEVPVNEPAVLVFPEGQLIDASFADEAIVRLYEAIINGEFGETTLLLVGLTDDSLHNINAVIHLRNLKLALLAVDDAGEWEVIGQLERSLRETLDMLTEYDSMTAPQLADIIDSAVNTASNRLKRLYDTRLIQREHEVSEKGLQYIYRFWRW
ncbi:MAG: hypothetical protein AAF787_08155 [Chloroflexota bacterium]